MNRKRMNIINKISRKRKIKYKFTCNENIAGIYSGFNDFFSEFLEITLYIGQEKIKIKIIPQITFEYINKLESLDRIKVNKMEEDKIKFSISIDYEDTLLEQGLNELYDLIFSKKVKDYYFNLVFENWKNKHAK